MIIIFHDNVFIYAEPKGGGGGGGGGVEEGRRGGGEEEEEGLGAELQLDWVGCFRVECQD